MFGRVRGGGYRGRWDRASRQHGAVETETGRGAGWYYRPREVEARVWKEQCVMKAALEHAA